MDILDGIVNYLASKSLLTNLLGTGSGFKLFEENAQQNSQRPYVTYGNDATDRELHLNGASQIGDFFLTFEVYADNAKDRQSIGEALRNILHSRQNVLLTDSSNNNIRLEWCELQRDRNSRLPQPDGTEEVVFCRTMHFRFVLDEVKPSLP